MLCDSPDVSGDTENPRAGPRRGPPAPSGTVPQLLGIRRLRASAQRALLYFSLGDSILHALRATGTGSCIKLKAPQGEAVASCRCQAAAGVGVSEAPALLWEQAAQYFVSPRCGTCGPRPYLLHASQTLFSNANSLTPFFPVAFITP